jgi:hypothetical protein
MAKLYWRIKKNGKWNWLAACSKNTVMAEHLTFVTDVRDLEYQEEKE